MRYYLVQEGQPLELNHEIADVNWDDLMLDPPGDTVVIYAETPEEAIEIAEEYDANRHQPEKIWCETCSTAHRVLKSSTLH